MENNIILNGFGRIGRNILRLLFEQYDCGKVIAINEPYANLEDLCYAIKYDSVLGRFKGIVIIRDNNIVLRNDKKEWIIKLIRSENLDIKRNDIILIDSSSIKNVSRLCSDNTNVKYIFLTKWYEKASKIHLYDKNYIVNDYNNNIISCGICDTVGIVPVFDLLSFNSINNISIITLHPFLGYQNIADGFSRENNHMNFPNIQMGRSAPNSVIPKQSSVKDILIKLHPQLRGKLTFMTYRVPTEVVTVCDITITYNKSYSHDEIMKVFSSLSSKLPTTSDPLVSRDFYDVNNNCTLDLNWSYVNDNTIHLTLWYNNELGYSSSVCNAIMNLQV